MDIILRKSMPHLNNAADQINRVKFRRKSLKSCSLGFVKARIQSFNRQSVMEKPTSSPPQNLAGLFGSVKSLISIFDTKNSQESLKNIYLQNSGKESLDMKSELEKMVKPVGNDSSRSSMTSDVGEKVEENDCRGPAKSENDSDCLMNIRKIQDAFQEAITTERASKMKKIQTLSLSTVSQADGSVHEDGIALNGNGCRDENTLSDMRDDGEILFNFEDEFEENLREDRNNWSGIHCDDDGYETSSSYTKEGSFEFTCNEVCCVCDAVDENSKRISTEEGGSKSSNNGMDNNSQDERQDTFTDYDNIENQYEGVAKSTLTVSEAMGRNSWRTRGIRRKKSDIHEEDEMPGSTIASLQNQTLYQTLTDEEDNHLRNSIRNTPASNSEALGMYLLCRNGNQMTIQLVGQHLSQHPSLGIDTGPIKTLWQNLPEVTSSGILGAMSKQKIQLQEALFEIFSTEASYVQSLNVLEEHFMSKISSIVSSKQFHDLFAPMQPFILTARTFLGEIVNLWTEDVKLSSLCKLVKKYYESNRDCFIKYAKNLETMLRMIRQLADDIPEFKDLLSELQESEITNRLSLESFMNLPLQRLTRMPLLLKSVIAKAGQNSEFYFQYISAITVVEKVCTDCNDELTRLKRIEEMLNLSNELEFDNAMKSLPLIQGNDRFLIHRAPGRKTKFKKPKIEIFLFNDLFLAAKKQSKLHYADDKSLLVFSCCPRAALRVKVPSQEKKTVEFELLSNAEGKKETLVFEFDFFSDYKRWTEALEVDATVRQKLYEEGVAQAVVLEKHVAERQDELNLDIGDIVNIIGGDIDGWYQGERLKDGREGWFRATCCELIKSDGLKRFNVHLRKQLRDQANKSHISLASSTDLNESLV